MSDRPYDVITFDCYGTLVDWEGGITLTSPRRYDNLKSDAGCTPRRVTFTTSSRLT